MPHSKASGDKQNHILSSLPLEEYQRIAPHLQRVELALGEVLYEPGATQKFAYFPLTAVVAFLYASREGKTMKVAMTGREGLVGLMQILEGDRSLRRAQVQSAGTALRIPTDDLKREFFRGGQLMFELLRYVQYHLFQTSQLAICNRYHRLEQQLCRLLLHTLDRTDSMQIAATQDMLSNLLGARRQGLSEASAQLEALGVIERRRGVINVPNPKGLEAHACECYGVIKQEYMRLFSRHITSKSTRETSNSSVLQSSFLSQRVQALEMALAASELAWWDVNLVTGENEVVGSTRWLGMLGYAPGEMNPSKAEWDKMVHPDDRALREAAREAHLNGSKAIYECEYRMAHKDGHWVWISARGSVATRDAKGRPLRLVGTNQDITVRKEAEFALQKLVRTDFLTGATSRRQFFDIAQREFARAKRHNAPLSLMAIDLDHFKRINDTYGHAAGDQVLKEFTSAVTAFLRVSDVLGRTGGEEFCLLMPHTDEKGALILAERLLKAVLAHPVQTGKHSIAYTTSLGVCTLRLDMPDFAALMHSADEALYRAKVLGRNRLVVAREDM
jgi:diguanylate cyclase (GGDEF)-like protein/PAS domain S-box-containing protein